MGNSGIPPISLAKLGPNRCQMKNESQDIPQKTLEFPNVLLEDVKGMTQDITPPCYLTILLKQSRA